MLLSDLLILGNYEMTIGQIVAFLMRLWKLLQARRENGSTDIDGFSK